MTLQRNTNPIPLGRYWIIVQDLPEGQLDDFDQWLRDSSGSVKVESTDLDKDSDPVNEFVIFRVTGPGAFFESQRFGFPNIAESQIHSRDDAVQAEKVKVPDTGDLLQALISFGKVSAYITLGVVLIKVLRGK